jgi:hypothetical protein
MSKTTKLDHFVDNSREHIHESVLDNARDYAHERVRAYAHECVRNIVSVGDYGRECALITVLVKLFVITAYS